jgi:hypothetical protein
MLLDLSTLTASWLLLLAESRLNCKSGMQLVLELLQFLLSTGRQDTPIPLSSSLPIFLGNLLTNALELFLTNDFHDLIQALPGVNVATIFRAAHATCRQETDVKLIEAVQPIASKLTQLLACGDKLREGIVT